MRVRVRVRVNPTPTPNPNPNPNPNQCAGLHPYPYPCAERLPLTRSEPERSPEPMGVITSEPMRAEGCKSADEPRGLGEADWPCSYDFPSHQQSGGGSTGA